MFLTPSNVWEAKEEVDIRWVITKNNRRNISKLDIFFKKKKEINRIFGYFESNLSYFVVVVKKEEEEGGGGEEKKQ